LAGLNCAAVAIGGTTGGTVQVTGSVKHISRIPASGGLSLSHVKASQRALPYPVPRYTKVREVMLDRAMKRSVAASDGVKSGPKVILRMPSSGEIVRLALVIITLVALAILAWRIRDVLLLGFAAILVGVTLRGLGEETAWITGWRMGASLTTAIIGIIALSAAFIFVLGRQLISEAGQVIDDLPELLDSLGNQIGIADLGATVVERINEWFAWPALVDSVVGMTASVISAGAGLLIAVTAGIYLAYRPETYFGGLLRLVPRGQRPIVADALKRAGSALGQWVKGQLISMLLVGVLMTLGLWVLALPSALALGVFAGLLKFVPYVGPFVAAAAALLIGLGEGGSTVFWVAGIFFAVYQLEGNVITPLIQHRIANLPPVLAILSLAAMGAVFGPIGVLVAIPFAIVAMAFVTRIYMEEALHDTETA
jgi:predicted PurR-regulated permease PerM